MGSQARPPCFNYQGKNGHQAEQVTIKGDHKWVQVIAQVSDQAVHTGEHNRSHEHVEQAFARVGYVYSHA